jgi:Asp-tRNA(Asn)/Glu-tRNA(Gln) amidotransferase A subunit family amidase
MADANELTATQALALVRSGELTVEALAEACLARIRERDPVVKGWVYLNPGVCTENLNPGVAVMKSTQNGKRCDALGPLIPGERSAHLYPMIDGF